MSEIVVRDISPIAESLGLFRSSSVEEIGVKQKEQGRRRRTTRRVVPSPNYKRASAC